VHHAVLQDGKEVCVKVMYPKVSSSQAHHMQRQIGMCAWCPSVQKRDMRA
jgi:predicted unusual protein kinase regulating ubiquinone biosynthesis (AarF/ABC1/UbiB family)